MLGGVPLAKPLALVAIELAALNDLASVIRILSFLTIAWLFVVAFRYRRFGLDW